MTGNGRYPRHTPLRGGFRMPESRFPVPRSRFPPYTTRSVWQNAPPRAPEVINIKEYPCTGYQKSEKRTQFDQKRGQKCEKGIQKRYDFVLPILTFGGRNPLGASAKADLTPQNPTFGVQKWRSKSYPQSPRWPAKRPARRHPQQVVVGPRGGLNGGDRLHPQLRGRLRQYFFLCRQIGDPSVDLLRFFLNHHRIRVVPAQPAASPDDAGEGGAVLENDLGGVPGTGPVRELRGGAGAGAVLGEVLQPQAAAPGAGWRVGERR
jgi:hypothetical protein